MRYYPMGRVGHFGYRLYSLGWRSGLYTHLPLAQHWLLSIFYYYRRGYTEGSKQVREYRLERNLR